LVEGQTKLRSRFTDSAGKLLVELHEPARVRTPTKASQAVRSRLRVGALAE
jgi:hypothetical protein